MRCVFALLAFFAVNTVSTANAAVAIFGQSVFSQSGTTNAGNALNTPDGAGAVISNGGELVIDLGEWVAADIVTLTTLPSGFIAGGAVSIGHVVSGVAVFSAEQTFVSFGAGTFNFDFSADCATISALGCSLVRVRTTGTFFSPGISLDGVTSSAPEPAAWALMILGFGLVSMRMKQLRGGTQPELVLAPANV